MEIYVDKLPKCCWECPCFRSELELSCGLDEGEQYYFLDEIEGGNCPLKLIDDYVEKLTRRNNAEKNTKE